jgi:hypothetical protein
MHADEELRDFQSRHPEAITHIRTLQATTKGIFPTTFMSTNVPTISSPVQSIESEGIVTSGPVTELLGIRSAPTRPIDIPPVDRQRFRIWYNFHKPSTWRTPSPSASTTSHRASSSEPDESEQRQTYTVLQTLIDPKHVRRTLATASTQLATLQPVDASFITRSLTQHAGVTPYVPPRSLSASPHPSDSSFPCPSPEPIPIPSPVPLPIQTKRHSSDVQSPKGEHSVGSLSPHTRGTSARSSLQCHHPYQKKGQEAEEVCQHPGGSMGAGAGSTNTDADDWSYVDQVCTWQDYENLTPPQPGFCLNQGADYVPCQIRDDQGVLWPAKWTCIDKTDDTHVVGIRADSPNAYSERLTATPSHDLLLILTYMPEDLYFFEIDHPARFEVDDAIQKEGDHSLGAEVRRYQAQHSKMKHALSYMEDAQHKYYMAVQERQAVARRLEAADALTRIMANNQQEINDVLK